jgi:hypothetical protein
MSCSGIDFPTRRCCMKRGLESSRYEPRYISQMEYLRMVRVTSSQYFRGMLNFHC